MWQAEDTIMLMFSTVASSISTKSEIHEVIYLHSLTIFLDTCRWI